MRRAWRIAVWSMAVFAIMIGAGATGLYMLRIWFSEGHCPEPGTVEFCLTMTDDLVLDAPQPGRTSEVKYESSGRDGLKPPMQGISFHSSMDRRDIYESYKSYLGPLGYSTRDFNGSEELWFSRSHDSVRLYLPADSDPPGRVVFVHILR